MHRNHGTSRCSTIQHTMASRTPGLSSQFPGKNVGDWGDRLVVMQGILPHLEGVVTTGVYEFVVGLHS